MYASVVLVWLVLARAAQLRVIRPLQVIANLLAGLREGHFTLRAREEETDDVLGAVRREVNALQETLKEQRLAALEADARSFGRPHPHPHRSADRDHGVLRHTNFD